MRASPLLRNVNANFSPLNVQVLGRTVCSNFKSMHIVCGIPGTCRVFLVCSLVGCCARRVKVSCGMVAE